MLPITWAETTCVPWIRALSGGTAIPIDRVSMANVQKLADCMNPATTPCLDRLRRLRRRAPRSMKSLARITSSSMLTMKLIQWIKALCGRWYVWCP